MDAKATRVRDMMNRDIKTIDKTTSIISAVKLMLDIGVSSLMVEPVHDYDTFGILTRKDAVEALIGTGTGEAFQLVEDVMTKPAITVTSDLSVYNCHQMMLMVGVRRLPVVDGTNLVGIISNSDILKNLVER